MLTRLGAFVIRHRKVVLIGAVIVFAISGAYGGSVSKHLELGRLRRPELGVLQGRRLRWPAPSAPARRTSSSS